MIFFYVRTKKRKNKRSDYYKRKPCRSIDMIMPTDNILVKDYYKISQYKYVKI